MDTEKQEVVCPHCKKSNSVRNKLLTLPTQFKQPKQPTEHIAILVYPDYPKRNVPVAAGFFLNGFFCDTCSVGFVTFEILQELGLDESATVTNKRFSRSTFMPEKQT